MWLVVSISETFWKLAPNFFEILQTVIQWLLLSKNVSTAHMVSLTYFEETDLNMHKYMNYYHNTLLFNSQSVGHHTQRICIINNIKYNEVTLS